MSDHGRIIPLSHEPYEPERHIEIYAGSAIEDEDLSELSVTGTVDRHLDSIREGSREHQIEVRKRTKLLLAGLSAERAISRYYDLKLKMWMIEDSIVCLRSGIEYHLYLRTYEEKYDQDRAVLERLVASFTLKPRK